MTEALERLVTDAEFRAQLQADPDAALAGYHLDDEERAILTGNLDEAVGASGRVEQRISKSGMFAGVLDGLDGPAGSGTDGSGTDGSGGSGGGRGGLDSIVSPDAEPEAVIHPTYPGVYIAEDPAPPPAEGGLRSDGELVQAVRGDPAGEPGQDLLAHEATHVAQSDDAAQPAPPRARG